jgi:hypothetical protein
MPLLAAGRTAFGQFMGVEQSHTTQPSTAYGATITPGNNTFGSSVKVGSNLALDAYGIYICVNSVAVSGQSKAGLLQIGFDWSGGTSFPSSPDEFNSITLLASAASGMVAGGVNYYFPLFIPAGTGILARGSVGNATVGSMRVFWQTVARPKRPELVRSGSYVVSLGATPASSSGTAVTPGTTGEGAWTSLGALPSDRPCWFWEWGFGIANGTMANQMHVCDLAADSSGARIILNDGTSGCTTAEAITKIHAIGSASPGIADVAGGTTIYGRCRVSGSVTSNSHMMAYGVGG